MQAKHLALSFIMSLATQFGSAQSAAPEPTKAVSPNGDTLLLDKGLPGYQDVVFLSNPIGSSIQEQYALVTQSDLGPAEHAAGYKKQVFLHSEDFHLTSSDILGTSTAFRGNNYELDFYETTKDGRPEKSVRISVPGKENVDASAFCSNLSPDGVKAAIEAGGAPALVSIVKNLQAG